MKINLGTIDVSDDLRREIRKRGGRKGLATRSEILELATPAVDDALARAVVDGRAQEGQAPAPAPADDVTRDPQLRNYARVQRRTRGALVLLRSALPWLERARAELPGAASLDVAAALVQLEDVAGFVGLMQEDLPAALARAVEGREAAELEALDDEGGPA